MLVLVLALVALIALAVALTVHEPRRAANAPLVFGAALATIAVARLVGAGDGLIEAWLLLIAAASPLLLLALVVVLLVNATRMIRRESRSLPNLLSGLAGLGLIGVTLLAFWLVTLFQPGTVALALWLFLTTGWLGFLFVSMLLYQVIYSLISTRRRPDYIVVLGAGLVNGKVGRLLAARVAVAARISKFWAGKHHSPMLVMSGGQGDDEPRPESEAMAEYASTELAVPAELILLESASTSTEENLQRTAELVAADPRLGPDAVGLAVTSNFHVLRAADLARRIGLRLQVTGAPVAPYYWPSAVLREFVAQLVNHKWAVLISTALVTIPLPLFVALAA